MWMKRSCSGAGRWECVHGGSSWSFRLMTFERDLHSHGQRIVFGRRWRWEAPAALQRCSSSTCYWTEDSVHQMFTLNSPNIVSEEPKVVSSSVQMLEVFGSITRNRKDTKILFWFTSGSKLWSVKTPFSSVPFILVILIRFLFLSLDVGRWRRKWNCVTSVFPLVEAAQVLSVWRGSIICSSYQSCFKWL